MGQRLAVSPAGLLGRKVLGLLRNGLQNADGGRVVLNQHVQLGRQQTQGANGLLSQEEAGNQAGRRTENWVLIVPS